MRRIWLILETFLRSSYLFNAMLLTDTIMLEEGDKGTIRSIFKVILKSWYRDLPDKSLTRLSRLYKLTLLQQNIDRKAQNFIRKIDSVAREEERDGEKENSKKLRSHARRILWLLKPPAAPPHMTSNNQTPVKKEEWNRRITRWWTRRRKVKNRRMPIIRYQEEPSVFQTKTLSREQRRKGLEWYIRKFPIPRRGVHIPHELRQNLDTLLRKEPHGVTHTQRMGKSRKLCSEN